MHMDDRDRSIVTQVAFKEASSHAGRMGMDLTVPEHMAAFEQVFSFLTESLFQAIGGQTAAESVIKAFPGTQVVAAPQYGQQPQYAQQGSFQQPQAFPQQRVLTAPRVKGQSNGEFPEWALQAFAEQGVTEVYDNRHMLATNPKRPWFKSTTGGDNAPAFWPPDR
jgi:hypothetical protein